MPDEALVALLQRMPFQGGDDCSAVGDARSFGRGCGTRWCAGPASVTAFASASPRAFPSSGRRERTARGRRARGRAPACRFARARPEHRGACALRVRRSSRRSIMPRSATTQTRLMRKRRCKRSIAGIRLPTSAVFPGHISRAHTGPAVAVEEHGKDHLIEIGPMVLGRTRAVRASRRPRPRNRGSWCP